MKEHIKTIIFVVVLLVIGYFLLPYVKIKPKPAATGQDNGQVAAGSKTFSSDSLGAKFSYNNDQDGDGKLDTTAAESGDKAYVYYTASPMEQGQWVQKFSKDPNESLTAAIQKQFLTNYPAKDCYPMTIPDFYKRYEATPPTLPANIEEAVIAYPMTTNPDAPFWQNGAKCPQPYTAANGISYFWMDTNRKDRFYFFNIGQYAIFADSTGQKTWQDTFELK
jgi:hypothetical protein